MFSCYDRSNERTIFTSSNNRTIFFVNASGNGMSTFLYNVLQDKQYIFIRENNEREIYFDDSDRLTKSVETERKQQLDYEINDLNDLKFCLNLFYFLPENGTFFRNSGIDLTDKRIKTLNNAKFSFEAFLTDYILYCQNNNCSNTIYIIVDKVDKCSLTFLNKVANLLTIGDIKLILCSSNPVIKAEYRKIFNDIIIIDFDKPRFDDAKIIFDKLNMDEKYYDEDLYNTSSNLFEFFAKYQKNKRTKSAYFDSVEDIISNYLIQIPCLFSKYEFDLLCQYLENNSLVNHLINSDEYFNHFLYTGTITTQGKLYRIPEAIIFPTEPTDAIIAFYHYALNTYKKLTYDFVYHVFQVFEQVHKQIGNNVLEYLLVQGTRTDEAYYIIDAFYKTQFSYESYMRVCKVLFERQLYNLLFFYEGVLEDNSLKPFDELLRLIIKDKRHSKINNKQYYKRLIHCYNSYQNVDMHCLLAILYLDFCINHNKKMMRKFTDEKGKFYFKNYANSKYYNILSSIVAYYLPDETEALDLYNLAISKTNGVDKIYLVNNKFAYMLSRFVNFNTFTKECKDVYQVLTSDNVKWVKCNNFLNTNLYLYQSIVHCHNTYNTSTLKEVIEINDGVKLTTWDLYKLINSNILEFVFEDNYDISNFISLEKLIIGSERAPAKNIYYYNLYIMARCSNDKELLKRTIRFLNTNKDFKHSNIFNAYKTIAKINTLDLRLNRRKYVRFGYIFSRLTEIGYLFDEIAVVTK